MQFKELLFAMFLNGNLKQEMKEVNQRAIYGHAYGCLVLQAFLAIVLTVLSLINPAIGWVWYSKIYLCSKLFALFIVWGIYCVKEEKGELEEANKLFLAAFFLFILDVLDLIYLWYNLTYLVTATIWFSVFGTNTK